ncbi:MAG: hypothetical protein ACYC96_06845 [Fimbriimonadaceae bacterium]
MLSLVLALAIGYQQHIIVGHRPDQRGTLQDGTGLYWVHGDPMDTPQLCPQKFGKPPTRWKFYYHTDGYANANPTSNMSDLRFRVFSQTATRNETLGKSVAFELLVLWRFVHDRLHLDHKSMYEGGIVDVYLCEGGDPGGEQAFEPIPGDTGEGLADSIYIYDVAHFNDKLEQAREVAHEYGHAILPPVGGFDGVDGAEYWANGNLGEKLFLRWGRDGIAHNTEKEVGFMGTPMVALSYWVQTHVDPLVKAAAVRSPASPLLRGTDRAAFDAYQGIVLWCDTIMPHTMFGRSMTLIGSEKARDYVVSAVQAAEEATYSPNIPIALADRPVWIPVGTGTVSGLETVLEKRLGWWLVKPHGKIIVHRQPENG